jgi:thiamine biosynthesis lipoprotein
VLFDDEELTVQFERPGVRLDLGGYAKGYAAERAARLLRESGVASALLHGGTSSVCTIGAPPDAASWRVVLAEPLSRPDALLAAELRDRALSVSSALGRSFSASGRRYGHVVDPRTGEPARASLAAAVTGPSASTCEALSTALLVLGPAWLPTLEARFPDYGAAVASESDGGGVRLDSCRFA